jgi:hypothetical protein
MSLCDRRPQCDRSRPERSMRARKRTLAVDDLGPPLDRGAVLSLSHVATNVSHEGR